MIFYLILSLSICSVVHCARVGSPCTFPNKTNGICTPQSKYSCGILPKEEIYLCDNTTDEMLICVLGTSITPGKLSSKEACDRYQRLQEKQHTVGGDDIKYGDYPYMGVLGFKQWLVTERPSKVQWICTVVLISENYFLTAAHCATDPNNGFAVHVKIGNYTRKNETFLYDVEEIIPHPKFRYPKYEHDIALIKVYQNVNLSISMWPPCITTSKSLTVGGDVMILGWKSPFLEDVDALTFPENITQKVMGHNTCFSRVEKNTRIHLDNEIPQTMFCAESTTSDTCRGDSGGPVIEIKNSHHILIGITSFGFNPCGSRPSLYINVAPYLDWIECHAWRPARKARS